MQHFELWIFGSNNNLNIFGISDCKFDLQFQLVCLMLIPLLHDLLSPFANVLLNLIFILLHALFSPFANLLLNLIFVLLHALLSPFASLLLNLIFPLLFALLCF